MDNSKTAKTKIYLHVYNLHRYNKYVNWLGLGAYHTGVVIFGKEYSYGRSDSVDTGVVHYLPGSAPADFFLRVEVGEKRITPTQLTAVVDSLCPKFIGREYDILTKNCNVFCERLITELGFPPPEWINRLARVGSCCPCCVPRWVQKGPDIAGDTDQDQHQDQDPDQDPDQDQDQDQHQQGEEDFDRQPQRPNARWGPGTYVAPPSSGFASLNGCNSNSASASASNKMGLGTTQALRQGWRSDSGGGVGLGGHPAPALGLGGRSPAVVAMDSGANNSLSLSRTSEREPLLYSKAATFTTLTPLSYTHAEEPWRND